MKLTPYIKLSILLLSLVSLFHLSLLVKLIPYDIAWGGRLKNDKEMYVFELISISVNLLLIFILLMKGNLIKLQLSEKLVNGILWMFFFLFILNTVGNLLAKTTFEKGFSVLTLVLAVLLWKILKKKE